MRNILSLVCAAAMSLTAIASTSTAAAAATYQVPRAVVDTSNVVEVQHRRGFYRHRGRGFYNGHRGYRHQRRGYRYHNGYWFPGAAFAAGAILGGALAAQPRDNIPYKPRNAPPRSVSDTHVSWCYDRYRSYRASDNTFQPYNGPRRQCRSPYY